MEHQARPNDVVMVATRIGDYKLNFEVTNVGAGLGGGFENTIEFKMIKYNEANNRDKLEWTKSLE